MARYTYKNQYSWSADIAYIVGLIASDGCLSKDGRHIDFTSKDLQLAQLFQKLIKPGAKIGYKNAGLNNHGVYYRIQFSDSSLYDFLLSTGMTPNKSLIIPGLKIPKEYFADFLRGEFDGDGCIYGYKDSRWPNSFMHYTTFTCASLAFLKWIQDSINTQISCAGMGTLRKSGGAYQLSYAKKDSLLIFNYMYYDDDVPRLIRKYQRYLELFLTNPYAVKEQLADVL